MKRKIGILFLGTLAACTAQQQSAPHGSDAPPLVEISTEVVSMNLSTLDNLETLANMVTKSPPSRAELGCSESETVCANAKGILTRAGVPVVRTGNTDGARLVYEYLITAPVEPAPVKPLETADPASIPVAPVETPKAPEKAVAASPAEKPAKVAVPATPPAAKAAPVTAKPLPPARESAAVEAKAESPPDAAPSAGMPEPSGPSTGPLGLPPTSLLLQSTPR